MKFIIPQKQRLSVKGFIIPLTLLVTLIILTISTGISVILAKELYFSKLSRESQLAYYAADNALMCAIMVDDQYLDPSSGLGIFPHDSLVDSDTYIQSIISQFNTSHGTSITRQDIRCANSTILDISPLTSGFKVSPFSHLTTNGLENGWTSSFLMKMDLGDGTSRCASVSVNKTDTYRQIIARGFTTCNSNSQTRIERAVIDTTEVK